MGPRLACEPAIGAPDANGGTGGADAFTRSHRIDRAAACVHFDDVRIGNVALLVGGGSSDLRLCARLVADETGFLKIARPRAIGAPPRVGASLGELAGDDPMSGCRHASNITDALK